MFTHHVRSLYYASGSRNSHGLAGNCPRREEVPAVAARERAALVGLLGNRRLEGEDPVEEAAGSPCSLGECRNGNQRPVRDIARKHSALEERRRVWMGTAGSRRLRM